jgi:uncharacterized protein YkwD
MATIARQTNHETDARPTTFSARRIFGVAILAVLVVVGASACGPPAAPGLTFPEQQAALGLLNDYRTSQGFAALTPVAELNVKAQAQAQAMADAGTLFHSDLKAGVSPGWSYLGENVAYAADIATAQRSLVASPPHRTNMLDARFNQVGTGVVLKGGLYYVVQDFVQR